MNELSRHEAPTLPTHIILTSFIFVGFRLVEMYSTVVKLFIVQ